MILGVSIAALVAICTGLFFSLKWSEGQRRELLRLNAHLKNNVHSLQSRIWASKLTDLEASEAFDEAISTD